MAFTSVGKKQLAASLFVFIANVLVLVFSTRVNQFQEFFFVADLFPLGLSILTLIFLVFTLSLDLFFPKSYTARPQFYIVTFGILSIFWLAVNAFSTSRWKHIPSTCSEIPDDFTDERAWCKDVQALKAFVWIEWVALLLTTLFTLRYTLSQSSRGNKHILKGPLSRYSPDQLAADFDYSHGTGANAAYGFNGYGSTDVRGAKLQPATMSQADGGHNTFGRDVFGRQARDSEFLQYPDQRVA
jgi:hypothetical protein